MCAKDYGVLVVPPSAQDRLHGVVFAHVLQIRIRDLATVVEALAFALSAAGALSGEQRPFLWFGIAEVAAGEDHGDLLISKLLM